MTTALTLDLILSLYYRFGDDLKRVRQYQRQFYSEYARSDWLEQNVVWRTGRFMSRRLRLRARKFMSLRPQMDDVESEITYLLVREFRPEVIVEISPSAGWSSSWLLHALKDNGSGMLHSFDVIDDSMRLLPSELTHGRWEFILGDVRQMLGKLPECVDYLFMDADHSSAFAQWYIEEVLPRVRSGGIVSVHDVFHTSDPCSHDEEGGVINDWLEQHGKKFFTASPEREPMHSNAVNIERTRLGLGKDIHYSHTNSMIAFTM